MDLSVIVLSYNTKEITDECLRRLQAAGIRLQKEGYKIQVIVVDNASSDGSVEAIGKILKQVQDDGVETELITSKENTGFSKGNNIGIAKAKGDYILLLNSDALVKENTLIDCLQYFNQNQDCDVLGPKLIFGDGSFQPSAGNLPTALNIIYWILGISLIPGIKKYTNSFHPNYSRFFARERRVGWVSGAFFMAKKEVFEKCEGLDENIFMYLEEVELCRRIAKAGFQIWYVPKITVTHLHGASSNSDRSRIFINELKGLKYYFQKHNPSSYPLVRLFLYKGLLLRILAFTILFKFDRVKAYIKGLGVV